ncbi:MAG TPA: MBL fold metallo-hydrolase [Syntrophomonadaceae bacterium]|nr:MBL fold metallo-hydrolase [Syntrophomonadaceae bacterium]
MKLQCLAGNTYYIDGPSIIGVYLFDDRSCLLIDTGSSQENATALLELLKESGIRVRGIFNTHCHADHCAGNRLIQERSRCRIFASALDAPIIQNPILAPFALYSAYPPPALKNKFLMASPSVVTDVLDAGRLFIDGIAFQVVDLKGHTMGHNGIVTPDGIAFLGDSLIAPEIMKKFQFHYLADVGSHLETLDFLQESGFERAVLSHGGPLQNFMETVNRNRELFCKIINLILDMLRTPRSREEILSRLVDAFALPLNTTQYYLILATISAFLSYLCANRKIRATPVGGFMKFSIQ